LTFLMKPNSILSSIMQRTRSRSARLVGYE
jgi:hypothetical protein